MMKSILIIQSLLLILVLPVTAQLEPEKTFSPFDDKFIIDYAITPDGQKLVIVSDVAYVIDLLTNEILVEFDGQFDHDGFYDKVIDVVDISPDGKLVATGNRNATVHIWDIQTGELIRAIYTPIFDDDSTAVASKFISAVKFSPDSKQIAVSELALGIDQKGFQIWDINTGDIVFSNFHTAAHEIFFVDQHDLMLFQTRTELFIFSKKTGELLHEIKGASGSKLIEDNNFLLFVSDADQLRTRKILTLSLSDFKIVNSSNMFNSNARNFDILDSGYKVLSTENGITELIDVESNTKLQTFKNYENGTLVKPMFAFSGKKVFGISENRLNIYDISDLTSSVSNPLNLDN